ncbi:carboxylesterase family protein [Rothia sp. LK2588]|uniref:carboxylesterase family protein n=1 Tax=Rothia sp. LK2588 TaxID=3114369 RepID=UPI0034CDC9DE
MPSTTTHSEPLIYAPAGTIQPTLRQTRGGTVCEALGIPYARAVRFGYPAPVNLPDFGDPFIADTPAPAAPQHLRGASDDIRQSVLMSEECQNLSVIAPADAPASARERATGGTTAAPTLPVMVYFHGGSYVVGSGDGARYNPERLVLDERVIVVRVTFRLGLLGFLGGSEERPANLGLLDAREALRWVKANIAAFGGDPDNITIFGQSAGGDLVTQLLLTEGVLDEGLVHRAICQSAPIEFVNRKQKLNAAMLKATAKIPADAPAEVFGTRAWKMVVQSPLHDGLYSAMMPFGTQYGHYPLPDLADVPAAWEAIAPRVQVLIGANLRESAYFVPDPARKLGRLGRAAHRVAEYLVHKGSTEMYIEPARRFMQRHRAAGGEGASYTLAVGHPLNHLYSAHCTELALLFDNPAWAGSKLRAGALPGEFQPQGVAFRGIWAGFARTGEIREDLAAVARISFE